MQGGNIQQTVDCLTEKIWQIPYARDIEKKALWSEYFQTSSNKVAFGFEYLHNIANPEIKWNDFILKLTEGHKDEQIFLTKNNAAVFRINTLRQIFRNARFIHIMRYGEQVINSWGNRPYGFEQKGYMHSMNYFGGFWGQGLMYAHKTMNTDVMFVNYNTLLEHPQKVIRKCLLFSQVKDYDSMIYDDIKLKNRTVDWKINIPTEYHSYLQANCKSGNDMIDGMCLKV